MNRQPTSIISYRPRPVRRARDLVMPLLRCILALTTATLLATMASAFAARSGPAAALPRFAPGRILVAPQPGTSAADFQQALVAQGGRSLGRLRGLDVHAVEVPTGGEQDAVARLAGNPYVLFAELDGLTAPALMVNDPNFRKEWHLARISAPTAWDTSTGSGITIAILDTGVDDTHPDLAAQMAPGWNLFDDNDNTSDVLGHGTAVAGVAAAASNNGLGIAGVAGGARIMPVRITDAAGNAYWSTTAQALTWAADHGADVANISFDGMAASSTMQAAATYFRSNGGTVIVAAGNTGAIDNTAPTDTMIVVSATDNKDRITRWSTRGSFVGISAPGQSIYSTAKGGGYGTWSGTSMAAPMVAGTAALVFALRPDLTPAQVDSTLLENATDLGAIGRDIYFGFGRLNATTAVQAAAAMPAVATPTPVITPPPPPPPTCTRANPTFTLTPSQSAGVQAGTMVPFNVTLTNNDTSACDVSTFDLTRSTPAGWTASFLSSALSLSPGAGGSTTLQVTSPTGTADGSNPISATATNRSANTLLRSAAATYVVANPVQPVCTRANPTVTIAPSPSASAQAGGMVPFKVAVTNNDTSACATSTFDLTRTMPAGWTATFLSLALSLAPGTSGATTLQVTSPTGTADSSSPISATATNRSATTFLRTASTVYVVANAVPGTPTIGTATAGNEQASVSFTEPASNGGDVITAYTVTSSPGGITVSGTASPITVVGLTNGTPYTFTVKATNAMGTGTASAASNAVTPAAVSTPKLFGLHINHMVTGTVPLTPWPPLVPTTAVRLWDIGATWADINTASGVYDWTLFDAAVEKAAANGGDIIYTLAKTPSWASSNASLQCPGGWLNGQCFPPTNVSTWTTFIKAAVQRAAGKIKYWECWNEPNYSWEWAGSISQMVSMCQSAYDTIKAIDPTLMVIAPATDDPNWLARYLAAGGGNYADVMSFHGYPKWGSDPVEAEQIVQMVPAFKAAAAAYGQQSKPLWDTESSWTNNSYLSDTNLQAAYVAKYYLLRDALGVARTYWYAYGLNFTNWANFWLNAGIAPNGTATLTAAGIAAQQVQDWMTGANVVAPVQRQALANQVKNPTMAGAVPGTPGTLPTGWRVPDWSSQGLTKQIVGVGTENGIPYLDYRIFGTYTGSTDGAVKLFFDDGNTPASVGQFWTQTGTFKLVSGTTNNIFDISLYSFVSDNQRQYLQNVTGGGTAFTPVTVPLGVLKVSGWGRITAATTAYISPVLSIQYHPGAVIDMTLRIGAPTLDRGSVWSGTFSRSNGTQAQVVWDQAGASTYTPSAIYTRYRQLDGNTVSITPGLPLTIGYKPILLEN